MAAITVNEGVLLDLLKTLIRIESVNPSLDASGSGESAIGQYVVERLRALGLRTETQDVAERRMNVLGIFRGKGSGRSLLLNGHLDTVSAGGMEIAPFDPQVREGKVFGRGSLDMKAGLAAMLAAAESVISSGTPLQGDLILAFVADEEYASAGTEMLVRDCHPDAAIICEPTDLNICVAHKGFVWIDVDVVGKAAHGSRFDEGIDAITKAGKLLARIEREQDPARNSKRHPLLGPPSIHASTISGGIGLSTYPDHCKVQLERRTIPGETADTVQQEIDAVIAEMRSEDPQFQATARAFFSRSPLETSEKEPVVQALTKAYTRVLGKAPQYTGVSGWLDSGILAAAGIPTVAFGPSGGGLHAAVEYVDFSSVVTTAQVLARTVLDFCSS